MSKVSVKSLLDPSLHRTATSRICEALSLFLDLLLASVRAPALPTPSRRCHRLTSSWLWDRLSRCLSLRSAASLVLRAFGIRADSAHRLERAAGSCSQPEPQGCYPRKTGTRRGRWGGVYPGLSIPQRNTGLFGETVKGQARTNVYIYMREFFYPPMVLKAHSQFNF